jgi:hypothetical protein
VVTDDEGRVAVSGFLGDYEITWSGRTARFSLSAPGSTTAEARLGT